MTPIFWCSNCLNASTRPRIDFDEQGWCNACRWAVEKTSFNWRDRGSQLKDLLASHAQTNGQFDCVVPVSGGKDGSYVAHQLKHTHGMNPLCVTVTPAMETALGRANLAAFIASGYDHIQVSPNPRTMQRLNRVGFEEMGFPYYGWLMAIMTAVIRVAVKFEIQLVFFGEDGEVEYGGSTETADAPGYDFEYMRRVYYEGGQDLVLEKSGLPKQDLEFFRFPNEKDVEGSLLVSHWSYFENWDPYRNYLVAKEKCGLKEAEASNSGTFTNFAQVDQELYPLHTYLMYLKFGFGRATQDANIEIRRGAMSRSQGLNLVRLYDGQLSEDSVAGYLSYYGMSRAEFDGILAKHVNRELFEWDGSVWRPTFTVE